MSSLKWHNVTITVKSDMKSTSVSNCHFIFNTQPRLCTNRGDQNKVLRFQGLTPHCFLSRTFKRVYIKSITCHFCSYFQCERASVEAFEM